MWAPVYKQGAKFAAPWFAANEATGFEFVKGADTTFHIPDVYGVGISVRPIPVMTVNADAVRVTYSNLTMDGVQQPIALASYYPNIPSADSETTEERTATTPGVSHVSFAQVRATGARSAGWITLGASSRRVFGSGRESRQPKLVSTSVNGCWWG